MEAQELFLWIGSIALIIISAFVIFFFYVIYKINKLARTGFEMLNFTAREVQTSLGSIAKGWGRATIVGILVKAIRSYFFRR
jgi:hypothetical protein